MKSTGIVRRIDDLGRVVIPREIRRTLRIKEGDPLEIFVDSANGGIVLKKYSLVGDLTAFAQEYADSLYEAMGHIALIADRDQYIAVCGAPKREYLHKDIPPDISQIMENRTSKLTESMAVAPIISDGEVVGVVMLQAKYDDVKFSNLELKLTECAAGFLAKQMEG